MKECKHKFEPRYDEYTGPSREYIAMLTRYASSSSGHFPHETTKTYVADICPKCGVFAQRPKQ